MGDRAPLWDGASSAIPPAVAQRLMGHARPERAALLTNRSLIVTDQRVSNFTGEGPYRFGVFDRLHLCLSPYVFPYMQ